MSSSAFLAPGALLDRRGGESKGTYDRKEYHICFVIRLEEKGHLNICRNLYIVLFNGSNNSNFPLFNYKLMDRINNLNRVHGTSSRTLYLVLDPIL